MKSIKLIFLFFVFVFSHSVMAQIDSTKTSLYLQCANEILNNPSKNKK